MIKITINLLKLTVPLGDLFSPGKRADINKGNRTALKKMLPNTTKEIIEAWSNDVSKNFQRDVRKTLNINKLPRALTQLNRVLIDYAEALKRS